MPGTRREFLQRTALAGGAVGVGLLHRPALARTLALSASAPRRILILGGTGFIGPHQVSYAKERGHELTLFNRGRTGPDLFPGIETLIGDRNDDYASLEAEIARGRRWDVVIDNPASNPAWVERAASLLQGYADQYIYVSSISAYYDNSIAWQDETAVRFNDSNTTEEQRKNPNFAYGYNKARCEDLAEQYFPGKATIVRPGLIVGPGDRSDRFTYWPVRIDRGGEVLSPGDGTDPTQIIDARDLSEWMIRMAETGTPGPYNATGPASELTMAEMLYGIRAVTTSAVSFTWVPADFLQEHRVQPWGEMTTWVPPEGEMKGFSRWSIERALDKGLTFRPLAVTAADTLAWHKTRPAEQQERLRAGLAPDKEARVLAAWHARG